MITFDSVKNNQIVRIYLQAADNNFAAIGYKEHGLRHALTSAIVSGKVISELGYSKKDVELVKIAAYLHDIGNAFGQTNHVQTGAILSLSILSQMGMSYEEIFNIMTAIGNHEERELNLPNFICAGVILGDKTDVNRMRVRKQDPLTFDMHDRVNFATTVSELSVDNRSRTIRLDIKIDTSYSTVLDYFEIFISRMKLCRKAANLLNCNFHLYINSIKML